MTRTSKIYFKELNPQTKNDLMELKRILRLLPIEKRNALVDYIIKERDCGPLHIHKRMLNSLTSAYFVTATNKTKSTVFFDTNKLNNDFRKLADIDTAYPLFMECYVGKTKEVSNNILYYSKILCSVNDLVMAEFAKDVRKGDTIEEKRQKMNRYEKMNKIGTELHDNKCEISEAYRVSTKMSSDTVKGGFISKNLKLLENLSFSLFKHQIRENQ